MSYKCSTIVIIYLLIFLKPIYTEILSTVEYKKLNNEFKQLTEKDLNKTPKEKLELFKNYIHIEDMMKILLGEQFSQTLPIAIKSMMGEFLWPVDLKNFKSLKDDNLFIESWTKLEIQIPDFINDGIMSLNEFSILNNAKNLKNETKLFISSQAKAIRLNSGRYSIEGTFEIIGENIAYPINKSSFTFDKKTMLCTQEIIRFHTPKINENFDSIMFHEHTEYHNIISWHENIITAQSKDENRLVTITLKINKNELTEITEDLNEHGAKINGTTLPRLKEPRISRLINSHVATKKHYDKKNEYVRRFINKAVLDKYKDIFK